MIGLQHLLGHVAHLLYPSNPLWAGRYERHHGREIYSKQPTLKVAVINKSSELAINLVRMILDVCSWYSIILNLDMMTLQPERDATL
jgi:hypothetical protein